MPCYEPELTPKEIEEEQRKSNKEKYGLSLTTSELISHLLNMCCELGKAFDAFIEEVNNETGHSYNGWRHVSSETRNWVVEHQKRDDELKKKELYNKLSIATLKYKTVYNNLKNVEAEVESIKKELIQLPDR